MARRRNLRGSLSPDEYQHYADQATSMFTRILDMDAVHDADAAKAVLEAASDALYGNKQAAKIASMHLVNKTLLAFFDAATDITDKQQAQIYQKIKSHLDDASMRKKIFDTVCDYHALSL